MSDFTSFFWGTAGLVFLGGLTDIKIYSQANLKSDQSILKNIAKQMPAEIV